MRAKLGPRLTYANTMSTLAMFLVLGGGAYAATKINGKDLVDRSVAGKKLKKDALTGTEVNETKLGKVNAAKFADIAGRSSNVRKLDWAGGASGQPVTLLSTRGMTLRSECHGLDSGFPHLRIYLASAAVGEANSTFIRADKDSGGSDPSARAAETPVVRGSALAPGATFDIAPNGSSGDDPLFVGTPSSFRQAEGQVVYRTGATVITITFHAFVNVDQNINTFCEFNGTAVVS